MNMDELKQMIDGLEYYQPEADTLRIVTPYDSKAKARILNITWHDDSISCYLFNKNHTTSYRATIASAKALDNYLKRLGI